MFCQIFCQNPPRRARQIDLLQQMPFYRLVNK